MTEVINPVLNNDEDGRFDTFTDNTARNTGSPSFETFWNANNYWVFRNVAVPQGATISSAIFELTSNFNNGGLSDTAIAAMKVPDWGDGTTWKYPFSRPQTASVSVRLGPNVMNSKHQVTVTSIIQEIVDLQEWWTGNDICIIAKSIAAVPGQSNAFYAYSKEQADSSANPASYVPKLIINYGGGVGEEPVVLPVDYAKYQNFFTAFGDLQEPR